MTALFTPSNQFYTGIFFTLSYIANKYRVVEWHFGQAIGHVDYADIIEATLEVVQGGMVSASEAASRVFEQDIIGATK